MPAARGLKAPKPGVASAMMAAAQRNSIKSKANGALMRVMPLAVWAHRLDDAHIAAFAAQEASLSHPNYVCQDASAAYCIALAHLIRQPGDAEGALERAAAWLEENGEFPLRVRRVIDWFRVMLLLICPGPAVFGLYSLRCAFHLLYEATAAYGLVLFPLDNAGNEEVQSWYRESAGAVPDVSEAAGFVKWAFMLAFK